MDEHLPPRLPLFEYSGLRNDKEIRLVAILPGKFDDELTLRIDHATLPTRKSAITPKVSTAELRQSLLGLDDVWNVFQTYERRYIFARFSKHGHRKVDKTSWTHPTALFDLSDDNGGIPSDVEQPTYEALSYAWGTSDHQETAYIRTDDALSPFSKLQLRQNCASALRHLRYQDRERIMWVDAICINQSDIHERNRQLALMKDVYGLAENVVIWLGSRSEDSGGAIRALNELGEKTLITEGNVLLPVPGFEEANPIFADDLIFDDNFARGQARDIRLACIPDLLFAFTKPPPRQKPMRNMGSKLQEKDAATIRCISRKPSRGWRIRANPSSDDGAEVIVPVSSSRPRDIEEVWRNNGQKCNTLLQGMANKDAVARPFNTKSGRGLTGTEFQFEKFYKSLMMKREDVWEPFSIIDKQSTVSVKTLYELGHAIVHADRICRHCSWAEEYSYLVPQMQAFTSNPEMASYSLPISAVENETEIASIPTTSLGRERLECALFHKPLCQCLASVHHGGVRSCPICYTDFVFNVFPIVGGGRGVSRCFVFTTWKHLENGNTSDPYRFWNSHVEANPKWGPASVYTQYEHPDETVLDTWTCVYKPEKILLAYRMDVSDEGI
ncbi:hypothetical protein OQA88_1820 [Cercophora sp. LCS_1]